MSAPAAVYKMPSAPLGSRSFFSIYVQHLGYVVEDTYGTLPDGRETLDVRVKNIVSDVPFFRSLGAEFVLAYGVSSDHWLRYRLAFKPCKVACPADVRESEAGLAALMLEDLRP